MFDKEYIINKVKSQMAATQSYRTSQHLTRLETALADRLRETGQPVVTPYGLFHELRVLYSSGRKLRLRKRVPDHEELRRRRHNLVKTDVLTPDPDYRARAYRIVANGDRAAEEIACLVDRFCYVAHLSAMARYGLTDRRPEALHLNTPHQRVLRRLLHSAAVRDYGRESLEELGENQIVRPRAVNHPARVRGRPLSVFTTSHPGVSTAVRGTFARIATIGQTFFDMLHEPAACGGMTHVLEVWREHAGLYVEDIIGAVEEHGRAITKVRAGYILDEYLGFTDRRIQDWTRFAQRGGSRVLDPGRPFASTYSEKWMISLNV